jgi:SAM-dependent methyltransferase
MNADHESVERNYAVNAQYYDAIFPTAAVEAVVTALPPLLRGVTAVAEIGPGTGTFTRAVVDLLPPGGEVFAIEPAPVMRAALATRMLERERTARAVTVLPGRAPDVVLPRPVNAVVAFNALSHFRPEDRSRLWSWCARGLTPGGVVVLDAPGPEEPLEVAPVTVPGRALGRHRYDHTASAVPVGPDVMRWSITYRAWREDVLVSEDTAEFDATVVSRPVLDAELAAAGFAPLAAPPSVAAWRLT